MRDFLSIGSTPADEPCAQVGSDDYVSQMRKESRAFIAQLRRQLGPEPEGAQLCVKGFPHDFGTYHEVVCRYDDRFPLSVEYAFKCEAECPMSWDFEARKELGI